jgi:hypothetical protein
MIAEASSKDTIQRTEYFTLMKRCGVVSSIDCMPDGFVRTICHDLLRSCFINSITGESERGAGVRMSRENARWLRSVCCGMCSLCTVTSQTMITGRRM